MKDFLDAQLGLAHLYRHLPRDEPNGRKVLVSCVEGELHEVGARMASDFLEMAGFDVYFLGANVPTDHLAPLVREERPDLVVLSVAMTYHLPALKAAVTRLREVPVILHTSHELKEDERVRLARETAAILAKHTLSREVAIGRIRDALSKAGLGTVAVKDGWEARRG